MDYRGLVTGVTYTAIASSAQARQGNSFPLPGCYKKKQLNSSKTFDELYHPIIPLLFVLLWVHSSRVLLHLHYTRQPSHSASVQHPALLCRAPLNKNKAHK